MSFSQFSQEQIRKLKEAFQLIDDDGDGIISQKDLSKIYRGIGKDNNIKEVQKMLKDVSDEEVTFPVYLSIMSGTMGEMPDTAEIRKALEVFAEGPDMLCNTNELVKCLEAVGLEDKEKIERVLKHFSTKKVSGELVFKGSKFLQTISE